LHAKKLELKQSPLASWTNPSQPLKYKLGNPPADAGPKGDIDYPISLCRPQHRRRRNAGLILPGHGWHEY